MIGIDIVSIKRIESIYKKFGLIFLYKVFTENEIEEIEQIKNINRQVEKIAGKFAAKEAVIKAARNEKLNFQNIEITTQKDGAPFCRIGEKVVSVSISHEKDYVVAVAII